MIINYFQESAASGGENLEAATNLASLWIGIGGALAGSIISLVSVWLSNLENTKRQTLELDHQSAGKIEDKRQERLEELYIQTSGWMMAVVIEFINLSGVMKGDWDFSKYVGMVTSDAEKQKHDFIRLEMIVDFYSVDLGDCYERVKKLHEEHRNCASKFKTGLKSGNNLGDTLLDHFSDTLLELEKEVGKFKKMIANSARNVPKKVG